MANLTIAIDGDLLMRARIRALERGTSVNALLRGYLETFAGAHPDRDARSALLDLSEVSTSSSREGRRWTRAELHDR